MKKTLFGVALRERTSRCGSEALRCGCRGQRLVPRVTADPSPATRMRSGSAGVTTRLETTQRAAGAARPGNADSGGEESARPGNDSGRAVLLRFIIGGVAAAVQTACARLLCSIVHARLGSSAWREATRASAPLPLSPPPPLPRPHGPRGPFP